jgi:hypothetical protein
MSLPLHMKTRDMGCPRRRWEAKIRTGIFPNPEVKMMMMMKMLLCFWSGEFLFSRNIK